MMQRELVGEAHRAMHLVRDGRAQARGLADADLRRRDLGDDVLPGERRAGMALVEAVEQALRSLLPESKINLASFGNVVAHVHWHVMARFAWDSHFPQPLWGLAQREADAARLESLARLLPTLDQAVREAATRAVASPGA